MNHEEYREFVVLSIYNELSEQDRLRLESHLRECAGCRQELAELQGLRKGIGDDVRSVPEHGLWQARQGLQEILNKAKPVEKRPYFRPVIEFFSDLVLQPAYAVGSILMLSIGLFLGYLIFASPGVADLLVADSLSSPELLVSHVNFQPVDTEFRQVQLTFRVSRRLEIEGGLDDPKIQRLLAHALINEQNAGVRLRVAQGIRRQQAEKDHDTLQALIGALRTDPNVAVRREALGALRQYAMTPAIQRAFLDVLMNDTNDFLRIQAINALHPEIGQGLEIESDLANELERRIRREDNEYVRRRAEHLLREAGYNL